MPRDWDRSHRNCLGFTIQAAPTITQTRRNGRDAWASTRGWSGALDGSCCAWFDRDLTFARQPNYFLACPLSCAPTLPCSHALRATILNEKSRHLSAALSHRRHSLYALPSPTSPVLTTDNQNDKMMRKVRPFAWKRLYDHHIHTLHACLLDLELACAWAGPTAATHSAVRARTPPTTDLPRGAFHRYHWRVQGRRH